MKVSFLSARVSIAGTCDRISSDCLLHQPNVDGKLKPQRKKKGRASPIPDMNQARPCFVCITGQDCRGTRCTLAPDRQFNDERSLGLASLGSMVSVISLDLLRS